MILFRYLSREVFVTTFAVSLTLLVIVMSGRLVKYLADAASGDLAPLSHIALALIGAWMLIGLKKWHKWPMVLAFLWVHAVGLLFIGQEAALSFIYTDATIYFMASIMLVEPKTSPIRKDQQLLYGGFVAVAYTCLLNIAFPYAALAALALGDLGWMMKRVMK